MERGRDQGAGWWSTREARRDERRRLREERHAARQAARRPGRSASDALSVDRIAEAALALVDTDGLEALSLRHLAVELGVGATTIYWYVRDKDELLDLVRDRIAGEVRAKAPAALDWRERVATYGRALRQTILRHPNAAPLWAMRPALGPNSVEIIEATLEAVIESGLSDEDAANACVVLLNFVVGSTIWELAAPGGERVEVGERARNYLASMPADRLPQLRRMGSHFFGGVGSADRFELGLNSLLDGLALRASAAGR